MSIISEQLVGSASQLSGGELVSQVASRPFGSKIVGGEVTKLSHAPKLVT